MWFVRALFIWKFPFVKHFKNSQRWGYLYAKNVISTYLFFIPEFGRNFFNWIFGGSSHLLMRTRIQSIIHWVIHFWILLCCGRPADGHRHQSLCTAEPPVTFRAFRSQCYAHWLPISGRHPEDRITVLLTFTTQIFSLLLLTHSVCQQILTEC